MIELLGFISYLITLYTYVVIAGVVMSWLMAFGVVNAYNPTVRAIWQALNALTELDRLEGVEPPQEMVDESRAILAAFKVRALPPVPAIAA